MNIQCLKERKQKSKPVKTLNLILKGLYSVLMGLCTPIAFLLRSLKVRVLDVRFEAIGHLAVEPDLYLRKQALFKERYLTILFPPYQSLIKEAPFTSSVCNQFLLDCWKKHFLVIDHFILYLLLYPILKSPLLQYDPYYYHAIKVCREYRKGFDHNSLYGRSIEEAGGFVPLLSLSKKDQEKGAAILQKLKVPKGAWFVCFSCREPGYYSQENLEQANCRNSSIEGLELALKEIGRRGGWCLRIGSPSTAPLPASIANLPYVIDYSHTEFVSDFMDIFLSANCRFGLGSLSGIIEPSRIFGIPSVVHNTVPIGTLTSFPETIHIFKLLKCKRTGSLIPFSESLRSYLASSSMTADYEEFEVELVENTQEEIYDAVVEMLDRFEPDFSYTEEEELLQKKFKSLMTSFNLGFNPLSRVGKEFLKKYRNLLMSKEELCLK